MKFAAVSTFNADGLHLYGRRMMDTFDRFWPEEVGLTAFNEGWSERTGRERLLPLHATSSWLFAFKARHLGKPVRDYRMDAVRFSHKVAALCAADEKTDADVLIWVDGDVVTHSPVTMADLEALAPTGDHWIAWLDRERVYPECGFYMLNRRHERHKEMMEAFEAMYIEDRLFSLPEWHDSFVLDHVVKEARVGTKSLSGSARNSGHPLVNGPLSRWLDHAKGDRKKIGRTPKGERRIRDDVAYWRC